MLMFRLASIIQSVFYEPKNLPSISVDIENVIWQTNENFLSVALDSHVIAERWKNFDFNSERVLNMASALSPAYLRLGGTAADLLTFKEKGLSSEGPMNLHDESLSFDEFTCYCATDKGGKPICENLDKLYKRGNFTMTGMDWVNLNEFVQKSGWKLLFDFNVLKRQGVKWDTTNAEELLEFSSKLRYRDIIWELGNEPNSIHHQLGFNMTAPQLGRDIASLKQLLQKFPMYKDSLLVGPDLNAVRKCWNKKPRFCPALKYLGEVINESHGVLDAMTWHHYYLDGHKSTVEDFLKPEVLDDFQSQMSCVAEFMNKILKDPIPLWLGETSSAWGGGVRGVSDRYAAGFLWLDKLGLAALNKYEVIIRQTFYHGCYAMIGEDLYPNPDFWISYLYKTLVGKKVLKVKRNKSDREVRIYAHCAKTSKGVVLFGLNLSDKIKELVLESPLKESRIESYALSPLNKNLVGREILLNGKILKLDREKFVPKLKPKISKDLQVLAMQAYEMAFWELPEVNAEVCN